MAKVVLIGLEASVAFQIDRALACESHEIHHKPENTAAEDLSDADIVFAAGEQDRYMTLLKRLRETRPSLPFIVVTRLPETSGWLNALEAGATDYCSAPFDARQIAWLLETAMHRNPARNTGA